MITITDIGYSRGYSRWDHLLSDGELTGLIGREFRSVADAFKAAEKAAVDYNALLNPSPIYLTVLTAAGSVKTIQNWGER